MPISKPFSALFKEDVAAAGGKGASLGEMTQAGIPVPPRFVVLAETFDRFLEETGLLQEVDAILHTVNHQEIHTVEDASAKIQVLIKNAKMPEDMPDFISAMKKAVAFVTDEGGITCHAAIIAREMKKPCVIGTKVATLVFQDGDEVEVDADNGIVTILKHAE